MLQIVETSPGDGPDVEDVPVAPRALTDDQITGIMSACSATGDVHELEKYVAHCMRDAQKYISSLTKKITPTFFFLPRTLLRRLAVAI